MNRQRVGKNFLTSALILALVFTATNIVPSYAIEWSTEERLTTDDWADFSPSVVQAVDGKIWVFWHSFRSGNGGCANMYYKIYDGTWSDPQTLLPDPSTDDTNPAAVRTSDGKIWVVWSPKRSGKYDIFYTIYDGSSWSSGLPVTTDPSMDRRPSIFQAVDGKIWVFWHSNRTGNDDLFYRVYDGSSWSSELPLAPATDPSADRSPSAIQTKDGTIWVFWGSFRTGNFEIFCTNSSDYGASWSEPNQRTNNNAWDTNPSAMQAKDGKIWVVFQTDRQGIDDDLYYETYDGTTWSSALQLTDDSADDFLPSVFQDDNKTIWISWTSNRLDNYDIYYKTSLNPHDVAVTSVLVSSDVFYRGASVPITVDIRNYGSNTETFAVTVYYGSNLIQTQTVTSLSPGGTTTLIFTWDTTTVTPSHYEVSATAGPVPSETDTSDNFLSGGTVHVKIPGDLNGDGAVTLSDAVLLSTHYGWPVEEYPEGDINYDGYINVLDAILIQIHFDESEV